MEKNEEHKKKQEKEMIRKINILAFISAPSL
jgi:hypothetical protein